MPAIRSHVAAFGELDPLTLYALLRLRVDVFVVEQRCPYPELDGRDTEPETRHVWLATAVAEPVAYLRILAEPKTEAVRIGRVATAAHARGTGLAARLMDTALAEVGRREIRLDSQTHAAGFYARYGFAATGPEFLDDGIPHVPMVRAGQGLT